MPQKKILVADGESDIQNLAKIILERYGFQVILAADGVEALQKAENEIPDLILLDMELYVKNGFEVCKILKTQPKTKHIPVIMVSTLIRDDRKIDESGADGYIPKPFNTDELPTQIEKYLNKAGSSV